MPDFKLLLKTFKEEQLSKILNDLGAKSWKLLLMDHNKPSAFTVNSPMLDDLDFVIFVNPEDGITHYDVDKIELKLINLLRKINVPYTFEIATIDSFKAEYLEDKVLTIEQIECILQKADTLDDLYDKVFGVNKADEVLPPTAAAAADSFNALPSPTAADASVVADSGSKMSLFSSASKASSDTSSANVLLEQAFLDYMQKLAPDIRQKRLAEINKILKFDANNIANAIGNMPSCS